jgi:hypothetical protein
MFCKIFSQIFDSSIADDPHVRRMFMDVLVLADEEGTVDMTPGAIAARTRLPIEEVTRCIAALEAADPMSRTPDMEGRRLIRLDQSRPWGWKIVNFRKYRESATKAMLKMAEADRKAAYRSRYGGKPSSPKPLTATKAEAEGEADKSRTSPGHVPDKPSRTAKPSLIIPDNLNCPEFAQAWEQWLQHLRERSGKRTTPSTLGLHLKRLSAYSVQIAVAAITRSIAGGYATVYPESVTAQPSAREHQLAPKLTVQDRELAFTNAEAVRLKESAPQPQVAIDPAVASAIAAALSH